LSQEYTTTTLSFVGADRLQQLLVLSFKFGSFLVSHGPTASASSVTCHESVFSVSWLGSVSNALH